MATPTLTTDIQPLHTCESVTGAIGNKPVLESEIKKQGSYSLGFTVAATNKISGVSFSTTDLTGQTIRLWYASITFPNMDTKANGGLRFYIKGGSTAYWNIAGSDTYFGGWINIVVDADSTPDSGSFTKTAVTEIGVEITTVSSPKNVTNTWIDYARYGNGITATGGTAFTTGNFITLKDIAAADKSSGYGIVEENVITGEISIFGEVNIGNGATTTYYKEDKSAATFADVNVSSSLYKMLCQGSGCNVDLAGFSLKAYNRTFTLDANDSDLNSFTMTGCPIGYADAIYFKAGQTITKCVFDSCGQIDPSTATFEDNTISNSTDPGGALLWPDSTNTKNCVFINNDNSIECNTIASPKTFDGLIFDDVSGKYDVNNTSGSAITVNLSNGSNANSSTGSSVTFSSAVQLTMTVKDSDGPVNGAFAYIDDNDQSPYIMNTTTNSSGIATVSHTGGAVSGSRWRVRKYGYKPYTETVDIGSVNISLPVTLIKDPQQV